ncbi:MAG: SET domain-containing protein [Myxococcota bacterium]|nr:SET domain-containing protein-lysine N-methyltransferase [Myxococcales bacterium]
MIAAKYEVAPSRVPGAGLGLFVAEPVAAGAVVVVPDGIEQTFSLEELVAHPAGERAQAAAVRWYEGRYSVTLDWPDECYMNHSFEPTGLWHLGFVFATRDLAAGDELTLDYRHLLAPGEREPFVDAATGRAIEGFPWRESLRRSSATLVRLLEGGAAPAAVAQSNADQRRSG